MRELHKFLYSFLKSTFSHSYVAYTNNLPTDLFDTLLVGDNRLHAFPKAIIPKVNVIVRLEIELAYQTVADQHVSHYTTGTH